MGEPRSPCASLLGPSGNEPAGLECLRRERARLRRSIGHNADGQGVLALGDSLRALGELDRAAHAYGLSVRLGGGHSAYFALGMVLGGKKRLEQARSAFASARALRPSHAATHRALAVAHTMLGSPQEAVVSLREALRLAPRFDEAQFELGVALQSISQPAEALSEYDALLARTTGHAAAHINRGTVLRELARVAEAAGAYTTALRLSPTFHEVYNNLAVLSSSELHQPREALRLIKAGRALSPDGLDWDTPHGLALSQLQRHSEASAAFARVAARALSSPQSSSQPDSNADDATCHLLLARMRIADWRSQPLLLHQVRHILLRGGCPTAFDSLYGLALPLRAPMLLRAAATRAKQKFQLAGLHRGSAVHASSHLREYPAPSHKLRVGFMSADYRWHVMAYLTRGMLKSAAQRPTLDVYVISMAARPPCVSTVSACLWSPSYISLKTPLPQVCNLSQRR